MDGEIEPAPQAADPVEQRVHGRGVGDIGRHDDGRTGALAQRHGAARDRLDILVGEGDLGALGHGGPRDAPGERALVGHAHHQAAPAGHQVAGPFDPVRSALRHAPSPLAGRNPRRDSTTEIQRG